MPKLKTLTTDDVPASVSPVPCSTGDVDEPGANAAAEVEYAAEDGVRHAISGLAWSYDGLPTAGGLTVEDGSGNTVFSMGITDKGAGIIVFPFPKLGTAGREMTVTLAAGGTGVTGTLSVLNHWTEEG